MYLILISSDLIGQLSEKHFLILHIFSAPEPKAQVHYCDHALSVVRRPSSVVRRR